MRSEDRFDLALKAFMLAVFAFACAMVAFLLVVAWRIGHLT
jgi:hypothetical protein